MPALSRATGLAAVALVAVVGAGTLYYLTSSRPGDSGGRPTPSPTQQAAASSTAPTSSGEPAATAIPPWDPEWTTYTSEVYGHTISYPSDWSAYAPATVEWRRDEPVTNQTPWADIFLNPEDVDGDSIAMWVFQMPASKGADLTSWEGLEDVMQEVCDGPGFNYPCDSVSEPTPMCAGEQECRPAIIVSVGVEQTVTALIGDPETRVVTVFDLGRQDDFPGAARYGGATALLKAIVAQVDVREPEPGETPH